MLSNAAIADKLLELAQFLAEERGNAFRAKAYRRAARTLRSSGESFDELVREELDLTRFPGIGKAIAAGIVEIIHTGTMQQLEKLRAQAGPERVALSQYPRLDAVRVQRIFRRLKISSIAELREALESGELLQRMGQRTVQYVSQALNENAEFLLYHADPIALSVETFLLDRCRARRVEPAGEYRRRVETLTRLDYLVETEDFPALLRRMGEFGGGSQVEDSVVKLSSGIPLYVFEAKPGNWGLAHILSTGSSRHLKQLRKRGCRLKGKFPEEADVYRTCGLPWIEPEMREGLDEVSPPDLIATAQIRGELHAHTTASDGRNSIGQMAAAARRHGYEYIGITDHSQSLKIAGGLAPEQLRDQIREIDQWNERLDGIRVLKSSEVDILADGSLDYPDDILRELDYTVCSIHSRFGLDRQAQTERILRAMDNRHFTILGHATGRLLLKRAGYELDMERVIQHARDRGCFFEINSSPDRLDLSAEHARAAAAMGVKIAINTDAHGLRDFDLLRYGVDQARRAGLTRSQVLNCLSLDSLLRSFRR